MMIYDRDLGFVAQAEDYGKVFGGPKPKTLKPKPWTLQTLESKPFSSLPLAP